MARGGVFQFEGFRLDRQSRVLFRRDEAGAFVPMAVGSRALDVLDVLLDRAGNLVLRDELMAAVWPATTVEDTNLNMQIAALRRILDEGRLIFAALAGWLADLRHLQQLAAQLAVTALTHHADLFVAFSN